MHRLLAVRNLTKFQFARIFQVRKRKFKKDYINIFSDLLCLAFSGGEHECLSDPADSGGVGLDDFDWLQLVRAKAERNRRQVDGTRPDWPKSPWPPPKIVCGTDELCRDPSLRL
jgi:hypothetical protein